MPVLLQGDIFNYECKKNNSLKLIYGHIGFNEMGLSWSNFIKDLTEYKRIKDPFQELSNDPIEIEANQWFWFVPTQINQGLSLEELYNNLDDVFNWVQSEKISCVITNGAPNTDHNQITEHNIQSDDTRALKIISYMYDIEKKLDCEVILISLNDVYTRNM